MDKINVAIIGGGWRAEFFIRIAKALPHIFDISTVYLRNEEKAKIFSEKMGVKTTSDFSDLKKSGCDYVIISLPRDVVLEYIEKCFKDDLAILCETPPGETLEDYNALWDMVKKYNGKIQVAEQYFEWPLFSAWLKAVEMGILGEVSNMTISSAHGYHGVNLIRRYLGITKENCTIYGKSYDFPVTMTCGRQGRILTGEVSNAKRDRFTFEFENGKVAFFDFSGVQYRSKIRTRKLNIQGEKGEIDDLTLSYVNTDNEVVTLPINRDDMGVYSNQDCGNYGLLVGDKYFYKNPFVNSRLNDDETAIASLMYKMKDYLETGTEFYSLADALQDSYFALVMDKALENPMTPVNTETQIWFK